MSYLAVTNILLICVFQACWGPAAGSDLFGSADLPRCPPVLLDDSSPHVVKTFRDKCYEFVDGEKTWVHARRDCEGEGGYLVEIDDAETMEGLKTVMDSLRWASAWNAANDRTDEKSWRWVRGNRRLSFKNWGSGQPNGGLFNRYNDCAVMKGSSYRWKWKDVDCDSSGDKHSSICMYAMSTTPAPPTTSATTSATTSVTTLPTTTVTTSQATKSTQNVSDVFGPPPAGPTLNKTGFDATPGPAETSDNPLSKGVMAGIVGAVIVCIIIAVISPLIYKRRRNNDYRNSLNGVATNKDFDTFPPSMATQDNPVFSDPAEGRDTSSPTMLTIPTFPRESRIDSGISLTASEYSDPQSPYCVPRESNTKERPNTYMELDTHNRIRNCAEVPERVDPIVPQTPTAEEDREYHDIADINVPPFPNRRNWQTNSFRNLGYDEPPHDRTGNPPLAYAANRSVDVDKLAAALKAAGQNVVVIFAPPNSEAVGQSGDPVVNIRGIPNEPMSDGGGYSTSMPSAPSTVSDGRNSSETAKAEHPYDTPRKGPHYDNALSRSQATEKNYSKT